MVQTKSKSNVGLGRSIMKDRFKDQGGPPKRDDDVKLHATETKNEPNWVKLRSVTQEQALEEFLSTAELAGTEFIAERKNIKVVTNDQMNPYLLTPEQESMQAEKHNKMVQELTIPRRPTWDKNTTPAQLARNERESFLEWRRHLALLQEEHDLLLTPFERNLEVWRQLWRVIERSDLIVQIVDGRNPMLFQSTDLVKYVSEVDSRKCNLLLVNKADMMTLKQRSSWATYFKRMDVRYSFFSAQLAKEQLEKNSEKLGEEIEHLNSGKWNLTKDKSSIEDESTRILTVDELEELFLREAPEPTTPPPLKAEKGKVRIGLVGYPNVGKSSTINALLGAKKVSVSATPGKTKHFQTIHLSPSVILCDCPGLVFPNFASTKAELVVNGILPIDQLRESSGPSALVAKRVPRRYIEAFYGITVYIRPISEGGSGTPTAEELLVSYARARGYTKAGQGNPDESRAARCILKDFVNGKLLYVHPPPDYESSPEEFNAELYDISRLPERKRDAFADEDSTAFSQISSRPPQAQKTKTTGLDNVFFKRKDMGVMIMSRQGGDYAGRAGNAPILSAGGRHLTGRKARTMDAVSKGTTLRELNEEKRHFKMKKGKHRSGWGIPDYV
ncbi:Large subunit GTPase 1 [Neolecta irregularis DAH-3]|uniref:Large subunit GTPase 1 n=1 Tax=Neolecta irregularis (strain DAH-3) TaxID=1198029 RepID=A0A1U7LWJ2_NEOID|nr:Large subunit GTPase 1 [Neolecta irregularis DAH-3]|eukprot:OLL26988.1 Large subunit GTPase 1 [Neolecta irregularis DAH-3]